jgi:uncharacterized protein YceK
MKRSATFVLLPMLLLSGCAQLREYTMPPEKNLLSGAGIIMKRENAEEIDVDALVKEMKLGDQQTIGAKPDWDVLKYRRNELQSKLIMASNQRCGLYLREITSAKAQTNMGWGSLSLLLSGAASVVPHAQTAKALAAGSAVATGTNAIYDQTYFNNLAVGVISAGITKQREGILTQISNKSNLDLVKYPVNRAVADALVYHSACNIISGLEAAAVATKLAPSQPKTDKDGNPSTPAPQVSPQI